MKKWKTHAVRFPALVLFFSALVNRGQAQSWPMPEGSAQPIQPTSSSEEPPLAESSPRPQPPDSPHQPFVPPPPRVIDAEPKLPFPRIPFVAAEPVEPPTPAVRLRVHAPAHVQPGKEIEYRLTVENTSRAEAHHVLVRDRLPRGVKLVRANPEPSKQTTTKAEQTDLLWEIGTLKPSELKTLVLTVDPAGAEEVANSAYVQFEHGQSVKTRIAKPGLQVRATAPARASLYHEVIFRLEVSNTGQAVAKDVVLTDELPAELEFYVGKPHPKPDKPLTWKLGDLAPGQTRRIEYQAISKKTGTFHNRAQVTAAGGLRRQASADVTVGEAKLALSKTGPTRRLVNRPASYHITVSNSGTMPATGVQVSDELPPGIEFLGASGGGRVVRGQVRWSIGVLPPGDRRSLQLTVRAPHPGRFGNLVSAKGDHDLSASARTETRFESANGPTVEIDKSADPLQVGQRATYTIRLINAGKLAFLRPSLIITVPMEMAVLGQRGPTTAAQKGQVVKFDPLSALEPGKEAVYTVEIEAKRAGEARLRVELSDGRTTLDAPPTWEEKTMIHETPRLAPRPELIGRASISRER